MNNDKIAPCMFFIAGLLSVVMVIALVCVSLSTFMPAEAIPEAKVQYQANITVRPDIEVVLYPNITLNATFYPNFTINPNVSVQL